MRSLRTPMICPLCDATGCLEAARDATRVYAICRVCGLIFVPPEYRVGIDAEKQRYELHDNSTGNKEYIRYLSELADSVSSHCLPGCRILDFGCGKNAALTGILRQRGFDAWAYDPLYGTGPDAFEKRYDAVILSEVIEHLRDLKLELGRIGRALDAEAKIFLRTQLYPSIEAFNGWWYKNDCTHINFFSDKSLDFVASMFGRSLHPGPKSGIFLLSIK